jgi:hemerythrin-like domain-containing protein
MTQTAQRDLISLLIQDHREVEELLVRLEELSDAGDDATGGRGEAHTVAGQVLVELTGHWAYEERYLYPLVRDRVPGGAGMLDREAPEQAEAQDDLRALDRLDPRQGEFWSRLAVLTDRVRAHVRDEEIELFPLVRETVPRKVLVELAMVAGATQPLTSRGVVDA